jgi:quercetin dioxygenase-like cupin family protein
VALTHLQSAEVLGIPRLSANPGSKTRALIKAEQLEIVHLVLPAGKQLPTHAAPGEITILGLEGTLTLTLDGRQVQLARGDFIHLPAGAPHAVHAPSGASALLTICLQPPRAADAGAAQEH